MEQINPGVIRLGYRLTEIEQLGPEATRLHCGNGSSTDADVVVGADGIRSTVRSWMVVSIDYTMFSKISGVRGVVPLDAMTELPNPTATQFWAGDGKHFLHFPIGPDYRFATFLAVVEHPKTCTNPHGWRVPCTPEEAVAPFLDWHPAVAQMINTAAAPEERWGLFGVGPLPSWRIDNVVLLGDFCARPVASSRSGCQSMCRRRHCASRATRSRR